MGSCVGVSNCEESPYYDGGKVKSIGMYLIK
jgi:hypothetical protein